MKTMYLKVHLDIDNPTEILPPVLHSGYMEMLFRKYFPMSDTGRFIEQNRMSYFLPLGADAFWKRSGPPVIDTISKVAACVAVKVSDDDEMLIRLRTSPEMIADHPVWVRVLV